MAPGPCLPPDVLISVAARLPSIADVIRCAAVCRDWRAALKQPLGAIARHSHSLRVAEAKRDLPLFLPPCCAALCCHVCGSDAGGNAGSHAGGEDGEAPRTGPPAPRAACKGEAPLLQALALLRPLLLPRLTSLHVLASPCFSGAGLLPAMRQGLLTSLKEIRISDCPSLSDDAVNQVVTTLTQLRLLHLDGCPAVSDAGLRNIHLLTALTALWLVCCGISDLTVSKIAAMRTLRLVSLKGCAEVTDEAVSAVRALPHLELLLKPSGQFELLEGR